MSQAIRDYVNETRFLAEAIATGHAVAYHAWFGTADGYNSDPAHRMETTCTYWLHLTELDLERGRVRGVCLATDTEWCFQRTLPHHTPVSWRRWDTALDRVWPGHELCRLETGEGALTSGRTFPPPAQVEFKPIDCAQCTASQ